MEQNHISRLLRNIRKLQWISFAAQIVMIAAAGLFTWSLADRIKEKYLWSSPAVVWISAGAVSLFIVSRALAWMLSRNERWNAAEVDRLYELKERVSTYVELKESSHPFLEPLVHETSPRLKGVSELRASAAAASMILPGIVLSLPLAAMLILPYLPVPQSIVTRKQEQKRIAENAREMEQFARALEKKQMQNPELKKLAGELKKVARELQQPPIEKVEALKKLNVLEDQQKQLLDKHQQKMAADLQKAIQQADSSRIDNASPTPEQKAEMEQLAAELKQALEGQPGASKIDRQKLHSQQFRNKDIQKLKEALKNYQKQKEQAEQMRAELKDALDRARKTTSAGKGTYTSDSKLKERDMEKGKGGVEDGPGTTNQDMGPSHFDTKKKGKEKYVEDRTKSEYERLYDGQRENVGKDPLYLESQWDKDGNPQYTNVRSFGLDKDISAGSDGVAVGKQNQGESAVRKERVPPSHEKIVKEYFEAIEE